MTQPTPDGYRTSLGASDETSITLLGQDLADDIMGRSGSASCRCGCCCGADPTSGQTRVFEAVLASLADHGFVPTAIAARLTFLSAPDSLQGAVAAGILGGGSRFLGVTEDCGQFLAAKVADPRRTAARRRRRLGRGGPRHRHRGARGPPDHPRARTPDPHLRPAGPPPVHDRRGARACSDPHLRLFGAIGRVHHEVLGRTLPLNGAGVGGAALVDAGIPLPMLRGVALLARTAGILGQLAEELDHPIANDIYLSVHGRTVYVDPEH